MSDELDLDTLAIRAGIHRSAFNEHSEALYLTSSYVFESAQQAADRFCNREPGNIYSRFTNPTVTAFQERLAALEGGEACVATSSGMAAILSVLMGLLKAGDHVVASQSIFGSTVQLLTNIMGRFGIGTTFVPLSDLAAWKAAARPTTRMFFVETPSNPTMELVDIAALSEVAHAASALLVVDNCFCTPVLQRPLLLGADLVVHSATKYLDGQGRVLGGAVVGSKALVMDGGIFQFLRTAGPSMSPFNAWVCLKGLETLGLRMEAQSRNAQALAQWLERHPDVTRVYYPGLPSHPQHELASRQQSRGGAIVTFDVRGGQAKAWHVIDSTHLISITGNLGDTKSTITHPATTTHGRISEEARQAAGIGPGMIRLSVGLESLKDLQADLLRGLG
ncbi:MAG: O-succinylhomoserine sulfhydrylase [Betaproteobacteria bacterium]|nr:O-succinylhomoserine sulfhydrylase [Betaproteobacteria bacterium]